MVVATTFCSPSSHFFHFKHTCYSIFITLVVCCVTLMNTRERKTEEHSHPLDVPVQDPNDLSPDKIQREETFYRGAAGNGSSSRRTRRPYSSTNKQSRHHHHYQNNRFPCKLRRLLDDATLEHNEHIISWLPDGKAFKIHDRHTFTTKLLGRYFCHNCFSSFTRQL